MKSNLRERTLDLVRNRPPSLTLKTLASEADVNYDWLKSFVTGRIPSPGVDNVEKLYTHMTGKQLDLS